MYDYDDEIGKNLDSLIVDGPCVNLQTKNLILQSMSVEGYSEDNFDYDDYFSQSLDTILTKEEKEKKNGDISNKDLLKALLKKKGKAFMHTSEYYDALRNDETRMKAYRSLKVVNTVLDGLDKEIFNEPHKFLNVDSDANFGETKAAYLRLSKAWFPDFMFPENSVVFERVYSDSKFNYSEKKKLRDQFLNGKKPNELSITEVEKLSKKDQDKYVLEQEKYRNLELKYQDMKNEMVSIANEKMIIINKAWESAKFKYSDNKQKSFEGFKWEEGKRTSSLFGDLGMDPTGYFEYDELNLEGNGTIRKDTGVHSSSKSPYLSFDYGDVYIADHDYRQSMVLKDFFIWSDLVQQKELSPILFDDISEEYKLNEDQSEQLRVMVMNKENSNFIMKTLEIDTSSYKHYKMKHFIKSVSEGPTFYHQVGPRDDVFFDLGVEITPDKGLVLKYQAQDGQGFSCFSRPASAQFTPTDYKMMQAIAYGPLLSQSNSK